MNHKLYDTIRSVLTSRDGQAVDYQLVDTITRAVEKVITTSLPRLRGRG